MFSWYVYISYLHFRYACIIQHNTHKFFTAVFSRKRGERGVEPFFFNLILYVLFECSAVSITILIRNLLIKYFFRFAIVFKPLFLRWDWYIKSCTYLLYTNLMTLDIFIYPWNHHHQQEYRHIYHLPKFSTTLMITICVWKEHYKIYSLSKF